MRHRLRSGCWRRRPDGSALHFKADAYASFLEAQAIPDYRGVAGNLAAHVLRRDEADVSHFLTVTFWESEESIRHFAFEPRVQHFEVTAEANADVRPLL